MTSETVESFEPFAIVLGNGEDEGRVLVEVLREERGLVLHREPFGRPPEISISHRESGRRVACARLRRDANRIMDALLAVPLDWTLPRAKLVKAAGPHMETLKRIGVTHER